MTTDALTLPSKASVLAFPARAVSGLSICIPVYNEEGAVAETLQRCLGVRDALRRCGVPELEVIAVDDGSRDNTAAIIAQHPEVRLIRHERNRGYGAALKSGFAAARYDLIGFLDADATYPPEHFPQLCAAALDAGGELVIGTRMVGADTEMPAMRRVGNNFFARLLTLIGRTPVTDTASGMRVFHRHVLDLLSPLPDGLNLTPVMSTRAVHERVAVDRGPHPLSRAGGRIEAERHQRRHALPRDDDLDDAGLQPGAGVRADRARGHGAGGGRGRGPGRRPLAGRHDARPLGHAGGLRRPRGRRQRCQPVRHGRDLQLRRVAVLQSADSPGALQAAALLPSDRGTVPAGRRAAGGAGRRDVERKSGPGLARLADRAAVALPHRGGHGHPGRAATRVLVVDGIGPEGTEPAML